MAILDLTLDKMRFPGIENFNPEFGTKETTGRGVHSVNLSENDMMPFLLQRPVSVVENSSTGDIEADRKLAIEAGGVTLTLGRPSYPGCKVTVYGSFSSGTATVAYDKDAGNTASVVVGAGERVELEANALRYFEVKAPAMSELVVASGTLSQSKTIPLGYASDAKLAFKVVFPQGHNDATSADSLTLNGIAVVSNQNGTLAPIPHHSMTESGSTVYKVLDPNTALEMYYTADYDGNQTPAFVIIGNPLVLSSNTYSIYANGWKAESPINSVIDGDLRAVTSNAVCDALKQPNSLIDITSDFAMSTTNFSLDYVRYNPQAKILYVRFHQNVDTPITAYNNVVISNRGGHVSIPQYAFSIASLNTLDAKLDVWVSANVLTSDNISVYTYNYSNVSPQIGGTQYSLMVQLS